MKNTIARALTMGVATAALAASAYAGTALASADGNTDSFEANYADAYAPAICSFIDENPSTSGVVAMTVAVQGNSGFDADSSVDVMNYAVYYYCPRHWPLLTEIGRLARKH